MVGGAISVDVDARGTNGTNADVGDDCDWNDDDDDGDGDGDDGGVGDEGHDMGEEKHV